MRLRPILALVALTTFFVEFVVGRSIFSFLDPGTFLFLFLGYGLVILVIRELATRHGLGLRGLILWGAAYGIVNEGLLAKTMVLSAGLPVNLYDGYGVAFGISVPWSIAIATWHAFASIVFPILIVHTLFPAAAKEPWLGRRTPYVLGAVLFLLSTLVFFSPAPVAGTAGQYAALVAAMAVLFSLGLLSKGSLETRDAGRRAGPFLLGLSVIVPFWGLAFLAESEQPVLVFFLAFAAAVAAYWLVMGRKGYDTLPTLLFFAVGWYAHNATQAFFILLFQNLALALLTVALAALLLGALWRIARRPQENNFDIENK